MSNIHTFAKSSIRLTMVFTESSFINKLLRVLASVGWVLITPEMSSTPAITCPPGWVLTSLLSTASSALCMASRTESAAPISFALTQSVPGDRDEFLPLGSFKMRAISDCSC